MRFFISLSYKGDRFSGWQIQENAVSIQGELERVLSIHLGEKISVTGCGRTDSGVNALNYIAHFDTDNSAFMDDIRKILYKINATLDRDIVVSAICQVDSNAHARFDAYERTYRYNIHTQKDPFAKFSYKVKHPVNIEAMNRAAQYLIGTKDFSSFEKLHGGSSSSICTVNHARWQEREQAGNYVFTISANRFLRNMVRAITGSLLEVGYGNREPEWINELLEQKDRNKAGQSVPGEALFLIEIKYPYALFN